MPNETDTTLSASLNYPLTQQQVLAITASEHATQVTNEVAKTIVGTNAWHEQIVRLHKALRDDIYAFLKDK
jgi:hypothetical protein